MTDITFASDLVVTKAMKEKAVSMTNGERRLAITQCLVALRSVLYESKGFRSNPARFWMEGGTLLATDVGGRGGHFIPWDVDGDVAMALTDWYRVRSFLNSTTAERSPDEAKKLPLPEGESCGCLLVDMDSFGSSRPSAIPGISGIPGRIFHECTGNWVDIFAVFDREDAMFHQSADRRVTQLSAAKMLFNTLPQGSMADGLLFKYPEDMVYPLQDCSFEGYSFECPAHTKKYLIIEEGKHVQTPDHVYDSKTNSFVMSAKAAGDAVHSTVTRAQASMCRLAAKGMFPPSVAKTLKDCTKKQLEDCERNFHGYGKKHK
jgi:hypothetical protein